MASFYEIRPLRTEISRHAKYVLTDGRTADWTPTTRNTMPSPPIVGGDIEIEPQ